MRTASLGDLKVHITGGTDREGGGDGPAVVLLHGFGAPGDDLVSLARVLRAPPGTRFVFPEAPLGLAMMGMAGGRAWWLIDMARLQRMRTPKEVEEMIAEVPPGLPAARDKVAGMLDALRRELRPSKIVLGGFSQGAMLSTDVALHANAPLAGLVIMSGALIAEATWTPLLAAKSALPVVQSHGQYDPILPFPVAERLRDLLKGAGFPHTWVPFPGEHAIPPQVIEAVSAFLEKNLA